MPSFSGCKALEMKRVLLMMKSLMMMENAECSAKGPGAVSVKGVMQACWQESTDESLKKAEGSTLLVQEELTGVSCQATTVLMLA
jgi:hypothetical protein